MFAIFKGNSGQKSAIINLDLSRSFKMQKILHEILFLTLTLTAVGRFAHTIFKGL
jgi:hypothetical protein